MMRLFEADDDIRRVALRTPAGLLAFGFGAGLSRYAPGTAGTLMAVPFGLLLRQMPDVLFWPLLAVLFLLGVWVCGVASRALGRHDPGGIVWDEMLGFWLCIAFLPIAPLWWLAAFGLFRLFDIVKPWPIRQLERRVSGGFGIMIDDVLAAAYAMAVLAALQRLL